MTAILLRTIRRRSSLVTTSAKRFVFFLFFSFLVDIFHGFFLFGVFFLQYHLRFLYKVVCITTESLALMGR
jgi:hypothetical protein